MSEIAFDDIQGLVVGGFNTDFLAILGCSLAEAGRLDKTLSWLASLATRITTADQLQSTRPAMKAQADSSAPWLGLAVGARIVNEGLRDVVFRDVSFSQGMPARAKSLLGDYTDPDIWRAGKTSEPIDVAIFLGSNSREVARQAAEAMAREASLNNLDANYMEIGNRLDGDREHFGFRDGISQPKIVGIDDAGEIEAGNFIFGYPTVTGGSPNSPRDDPRNLATNGSFLVFRRLRQEVEMFHSFSKKAHADLASGWPSLSPDLIEAQIVGRWPSGAPLINGQLKDPGAGPNDDKFDFFQDFKPTDCPFGAHIRKVNPRKGKSDEVNRPRILRRGIPFGMPNDEDRGLLFIAFQTSITNQFERITSKWMNSAHSPVPGHDLLVGRSTSTRSMTLIGPVGEIGLNDGGNQWITPTGGAYLFTPGRTALGKFADPPQLSVLEGLKRAIFAAIDTSADVVKRTLDF